MEFDHKYNKYFLILGFLIFPLLLTACNFIQGSKSNTTGPNQNGPQISEIDMSPFEKVDCTWQTDDTAVCNDDGIFRKMGCSSLSKPNPYLNLLNPSVEIVNCIYSPDLSQDIDPDQMGVYNVGCSRPVLNRYVVYSDGNYQLIQNKVDLIQYFAPIESPEEALAYAIAATGYQPLFNFEPPEEYRYFLDKVEETTMSNTNEGYVVTLFNHQTCGCGPHTTFLSKVRVNFDGTITLMDPIPAFEDPAEDDLCVD